MVTPIPRTLEPPPRSTGNATQDFPILIDWFWRAYQVIVEAVNFINSQIGEVDLDVAALPDPETATVSSAQSTANLAYALADQNADRLAGMISGEVVVDNANTGATVNFTEAQIDDDYRVIIQAKATSGAPASDAYLIATKTYSTASFSFTLVAAPGVGTSITFEWQLMRNSWGE